MVFVSLAEKKTKTGVCLRNTVLYHRRLLKLNKASISSRRHRLTRSPHCLTDPLHASPSQVRGQLNRPPQGRNRTPTSLGCQCATATHDTREKKGRTASNAPHHGGTPAPTPLTPRRGREGPSFFRLSLPCGLRMEAGAGTARKSDYDSTRWENPGVRGERRRRPEGEPRAELTRVVAPRADRDIG